MKTRMHSFSQTILDALFPPYCVGCRAPLSVLCNSCMHSIFQPEHITLNSEENSINSITTIGVYSNTLLQSAIRQLKFHGIRSVGQPLGALVAAYIDGIFHMNELSSTLIIPIPLHAKRRRERGYNQAEEIARPIAEHLDLHLLPNALLRHSSNKRHADMEHSERWKHIENAFYINEDISKQINNAHILLVDDVITTGATIQEAARILKKHGAKHIHAVAVARSQ